MASRSRKSGFAAIPASCLYLPTSNPIHLLNVSYFHKYTYVHMILCVHKICVWVGQL